MPPPTWRNFEVWVHTAEGRRAMNDKQLTGCPQCAICGDRTNNELEIIGGGGPQQTSSWQPCCICEKWICAKHHRGAAGRAGSAGAYCGFDCRAAGRQLVLAARQHRQHQTTSTLLSGGSRRQEVGASGVA